MKSIKDPAMTTTPTGLYLSYVPKTSIKSASHNHFLDQLGFKPASTSEQMRRAFVADMTNYVQGQPLSHKFLIRAANPEAFKVVVAGFLAEYGPVYWGSSSRDHLEEPDTLKGFLCPRDALRARSRLVEVVESYFNHGASVARNSDKHKPRANRMNKNIDFAALTGRKADWKNLSGAVQSTAPERPRRKRGPVFSGDGEANGSTHIQHGDLPGTNERRASSKRLYRQSAWSDRKSTSLIASAEIGHDAKRLRLTSSAHRPEASQDTKAHGSSHESHPQNLTSTLSSPPEQFGSSTNTVILSDDSDNGEKKREKNTGNRAPNNRNKSPDPKKVARIKDEPLPADIMKCIRLRVKADGPGISARGPILVDFEVYKTSERLFTSLTSERSLKPEVQKKVSQLTVTINGKETCCRRDRWDDWAEVCRELRKLWDDMPELFGERFEVDVMLHVDE